jgi:hypothetical protein
MKYVVKFADERPDPELFFYSIAKKSEDSVRLPIKNVVFEH